ncbi:hypothetical protein [Ornithinimicrobium panacihumi]|uniref:hypothetical protein n=1 Tax=Ornithinimicrobium panacihumi TaxID=2008449 RepID=UPI003F8A7C43
MTSTSPTPHGDASDAPAGLLLVGGPRGEVDSWVRRGVVPAVVAHVPGWTLVVASGDSELGPPYDDPTLLLAGRPVPEKVAPALGFFDIDGRAVITVHGPGRRRATGWVVWEPEVGLLRPPGLPLAGPAEITSVAGAPPEARDELVDLLHETRARVRPMLQAVMATLHLPAARIITEPRTAIHLPGAVRHDPNPKEIALFDDAVADSVRLRRELGALP